ncbi:MAG TPA: TetR/AcrR family transcriptional regulator [Acidimicrobiales bacterium]|jgi:AcrR family transcriptional regulator|nr:TetR/AcrR family transcriptional regulator [Acidimicrobiales bacterium]
MADDESRDASGRDGRSDRWRDHREARRAELIAAVIAVVEAQGPAVGMDDIARASGIAKPVFYRYFRSKSDLFLEVGRTVGQLVVDETTAAIDAAVGPRAKLAAGIEAYLIGIESRPNVYRFVVQHRDLGDYASIVGLHATAVIGEFMRQAGLDSGAAEVWGFGIVGLARAAADRWLEQKTMSREAVVTYLMEMVWPGLSGATLGRGVPVNGRRAPQDDGGTNGR